jgi:hypothetical protein
MAKKLEQVQREFNAATLKTRNTFDRLQNLSFNKTTDAYKEAEAAYKEAQEEKNTLRKELNAAKKLVETKKTKSSFVSAYDEALADLKDAELSIAGYQGEEKYQSAYRNLQKVYKEAVDAGSKLSPIPTPKIDVPPLPELSEDGTVKSEVDSDEFQNKLVTSGQYIANLGDPGRRELATQLNKVYGLKLPTNGKYSTELKNAYQRALSDNYTRSLDFNRNIPFEEFLVISENEGTYREPEGGPSKPRATISNKTQSAAIINSVVRSLFNREASPKEINQLTKDLNKAQRDNPFKTVNGITTGGLDNEQFLVDILKKSPEFSQRKTDIRGVNADTIRSTARSNFLELTDLQVDSFLDDLEKGQDINVINKRIRSIASMGMPDSIKKMVADGDNLETIYQPYKTRMASILELSPESININDPALRSAIGPDKEMPIYEFERALRRDTRWQYTDKARQEVSDLGLSILKDFGFVG